MSETTEQILIGSILVDSVIALDAAHRVGVTEEWFTSNPCRVAWLYIIHLSAKGRGVDCFMLWQASKPNHQNLLEMKVTTRWCDLVSTSAHAHHYAEELKKAYRARKAKEIAERLLIELKDCSDPTIPISAVQSEFGTLTNEAERKKTTEEIYADMIQRCRDASDGKAIGLLSPWECLNSMLNGWRGGDGPHILAARPGAGKSTFMMNDAMHHAMKNIPVSVSSLEMSEEKLRFRMLGDSCDLSTFGLEQGKAHEHHFKQMEAMVRDKHIKMPLRISDAPQTIDQFAAWSTNEILKHGARIIYLDYLQILTASQVYKGGRNEEVGAWMRQICRLDKQFKKVPFVILSQLNRGGEGRPTLKELRDSGSIEQDAATVTFIHNKTDGSTEVGLDKSRFGPTGFNDILFNRSRQRFEDIKPPITPQFTQ
jgi:replicative DNA helicase